MMTDMFTKKGKSRAKRSCFSSGSGTSSEDTVLTKRPKIDGQERQLKIDYLLEQIADIEKRIAFKQRRIDTAAAMSNFKACDELSQEISELKSQKHEMNCLLGPLQKKAAKSAWYYRSKQKKAPCGRCKVKQISVIMFPILLVRIVWSPILAIQVSIFYNRASLQRSSNSRGGYHMTLLVYIKNKVNTTFPTQ